MRVTGGKESERSLKTSEQLKVIIILPPHHLSMHCPWKSLVPGHVLSLDTQEALPQFLQQGLQRALHGMPTPNMIKNNKTKMP